MDENTKISSVSSFDSEVKEEDVKHAVSLIFESPEVSSSPSTKNTVIALMRKNKVFPVFVVENKFTIYFVYVDKRPDDNTNLIFSRYAGGRNVEYVTTTPQFFAMLSTKYLGVKKSFDENEASMVSIDINSSEARKAYETVFIDAVEKNATDIHIKHTDEETRVFLRINGNMVHDITFPISVGIAVVRIFIQEAGLKIEALWEPQSGKVRKVVGTKAFDVRIQTVGESHGYTYLVARLLPAEDAKLMALESLGYEPEQVSIIKNMIQRKGIILVTGPTGAGKTTTIYSALNLVNERDNIITIEDPPEIKNDKFTQIAIRPDRGISWESALKNVLRQDPDVIFIGEIRDILGAKTALEAAVTGHLVFATLHVNKIENIVERLLQFQDPSIINKVTIADASIGFISQRIFTKIYEPLSVMGPFPGRVKTNLLDRGILETDIPSYVKFANTEAEDEDYSISYRGYDMRPDGRSLIAEVLEIDDKISWYIKKQDSSDLRKYLIEKKDHITMERHALMKIKRSEMDPRDMMQIW